MIVLHLIKTSVGASWALRQIRELIKLGVDVHVAMPEGPMVVEYQNVGAITHILQTALNVKQPWKNFEIFRKLKYLVKEINPDIIHSHFVATTLTMRIALRGNKRIKRIFHVPGPLHLEHLIFKKVDVLSACENDYWIASCEWTKEKYISEGVPSEKIGLVYYGVDIDEHVQSTRTNKLRDEFCIEHDAFVVGNVSYFYPPKKYLGQSRGLKGHEDLIDAIDIVSKDIGNIVCVFVGGPWGGAEAYMNSVKEYADSKQSGTFIFTGFRSDIQDVYPDFDIACHPSHSENVGGAVESMLCGVATITTNVGGFPDLVKVNKTGWLALPQNPQNLAESILDAYNKVNQREQFSIEGRKLAEKLLNVKENAKTLKTYYDSLTNENSL
ncbi:MAG: glycosyltransferase involved in cell wall biosynthesis [Pseudohongiellaceae bacterium]|jgi:glycosyltransferase involved in cell wall biosynthesis